MREGQTFGGESLLVRYINFVKLPHTVFALPFALAGVTLVLVTIPASYFPARAATRIDPLVALREN